MTISSAIIKELVAGVANATAGSPNEASLRHEIETVLRRSCTEIGVTWTPFTLDLTLRPRSARSNRFVDVAHGAVVIEYEPPKSFSRSENAVFFHAREQVEEYAELISFEEGRDLSEYVLVVWDGESIAFGKIVDEGPKWERLTIFDDTASRRLLTTLRDDGVPLVHPHLLSSLVGPESDLGNRLVPALFAGLCSATKPKSPTSRTKLLFTEWTRLFGQVIGIQSNQLKTLLKRQGVAHHQDYDQAVPQYLFALNTYIALVAKLVSALALPNCAQNILDPTVDLKERMRVLENGSLFSDAGISNMLIGDFFSWYLENGHWEHFKGDIENLIAQLNGISFDITRKNPTSTRDLFKGMYESFVPRELRHALGEVYTPDWLAAHALDEIQWHTTASLLDPTCGTGTFLLEAIKRRRTEAAVDGSQVSVHNLLDGIVGIDLNPLAVLAARASIVVFVAPLLQSGRPVRIPVFLADAINSADPEGDFFKHGLQTEKGTKLFKLPVKVVEDVRFHGLMLRWRDLIDAEADPADLAHVIEEAIEGLGDDEKAAVHETASVLFDLHRDGWDGIWCAILADRFAAGAIPRVDFIAGNPPWVKWSHLPPEYASFIKDRCLKRGVFSSDRWVGGIESDISTVITFEAISKWLAPGGTLAFFITGTVFANESSEGFRRLRIEDDGRTVAAIRVEDFQKVAPFDGVTNHPTLLILKNDAASNFPIPYIRWEPAMIHGRPKRSYEDASAFRTQAVKTELLAAPVPGTDAGPWLKGSKKDHELWMEFMNASGNNSYQARKGITTDRNGIYFIRVLESTDADHSRIENEPGVGRSGGIPKVRAIIENKHLFPLIRGRGVAAFRASIDPEHCVIVPQRGMNGDPNLPKDAPKTHKFLRNFKEVLENRSSYKRFQSKHPYWSIWSTGEYTFSKYKVLWKEMSGSKFCAAYIGDRKHPILGKKLVIPDHKIYFIPVTSLNEAAYLTGILNSPKVTKAISAYAAQLSLGISVMEYLDIPEYSPSETSHVKMSTLSKEITEGKKTLNTSTERELDKLSDEIFLRK